MSNKALLEKLRQQTVAQNDSTPSYLNAPAKLSVVSNFAVAADLKARDKQRAAEILLSIRLMLDSSKPQN